MQVRKTEEIRRFTQWCFGHLNLRPIRIHIINAPCLMTPDGIHSFGCYSFGDGETDIYLAGKLPKSALLTVAAHEIAHYYQDSHGEIYAMESAECEEQADKAGMKLLSLWQARQSNKKTGD